MVTTTDPVQARESGPADAVADAIARAARGAARPVVLVDGRSGAGKSTLAALLAARLSGAVVRLDDVYPGWDGLEAASRHVREHVLGTAEPRFRRWDWTLDRAGEWQPVPAGVPLVVEGSGALSRANRSLATYAVWVELEHDERRRRALDRDGDAYAPHWDRWAAQEEAFVRREDPVALADAVVRSATWTAAFRVDASHPPLRASRRPE